MAKAPNILLIISDQHNPHFLGCGNNPIIKTPNLDKLAARGVRFSDVSTSSPLCVPARMGFMTGQRPSDISVWSNRCLLPSNVETFAHAFSNSGYETVLCGRMHFNGPDQFHGFQKRIFQDVRTDSEFPAGKSGRVLGRQQN